jgi:hypothetical protein
MCKSIPKLCATFVICVKLPIVKNRPLGENSPDLVTPILSFQVSGFLPIFGKVARFFLVQNTKMGENIPNHHEL